jgi:hypothetical protein
MKIIKWLGYLSVALGTLLLLAGIISQLFTLNLFSVQHNVSFIHTANGLFLLGIAIFIVTNKCCENCCNKDDK